MFTIAIFIAGTVFWTSIGQTPFVIMGCLLFGYCLLDSAFEGNYEAVHNNATWLALYIVGSYIFALTGIVCGILRFTGII